MVFSFIKRIFSKDKKYICPFCHSSDLDLSVDEEDDDGYVWCKSCARPMHKSILLEE